MSYSQLIILFLVFGFISYSYELKGRNNILQRRTRDSEQENLLIQPRSFSQGQQAVNMPLNDINNLQKKEQESTQQEAGNIAILTNQILDAIGKMEQTGTKDTTTVVQWNSAQSKLRKGISSIIQSYQSYIQLHQQVCEDTEKFATNMISKYQNERTLIDQMTAPSPARSGDIDTDSGDWKKFISKFAIMMQYLKFHAQTLPFANDCIQDRTESTQAYYNQLIPSSQQYSSQSVSFQVYPGQPLLADNGCKAMIYFNGNPQCASRLVDTSSTMAGQLCECINQVQQ